MTGFGLIGGTGLSTLEGFEKDRHETVTTPYGPPSADLVFGRFAGSEMVFLARHGANYSVPPHAINYRANLWALNELGLDFVVAVNTVGGIRAGLAPGTVVVPDQIIDYTYGREHTYVEEQRGIEAFVDMTEPYSQKTRQLLIEAARSTGTDVVDGGTYGAVQGPRLETRAEVDRMERDGCDVVGMTGMPEAGLARELGLEFASLAVVVNPAAGRGDGGLHDHVEDGVRAGISRVRSLLGGLQV